MVTISLNKCTNKTFLVVLPKYFAKNDWKSNLEVAATLWLKLAELCATESFKEIKAEEDMLSFMLAPTFLLHTVIKKEEEV